MSLILNVTTPTNQAQFIGLMPVLEAFYNIKVNLQEYTSLLFSIQAYVKQL